MSVINLKIGNKIIGDDHPCFIIAEIGCNHDGKLEQAQKMIDMAVEAGCDAVKFQSFTANKMFNEFYNGYKKGWMELLKSLEISKEWHELLPQYCKEKGIIFLSSICDKEKVDWLNELGVTAFKVPSYELTHIPLLKYAAKKNKPIILSTGIAIEKEIQESIDAIKKEGNSQIAMMHCVSSYPAVIKELNLRTIQYYKEKFRIPVGLSDHTLGIDSSVYAVLLGANLVEKHITLDKSLLGPDHHFALNPIETKEWVKQIRLAESAIGTIKKSLAFGEKNEIYWRRSLWAKKDLVKGNILKEEEVMIVRPSPEGSLPPKEIYNILGKEVGENIKEGDGLKINEEGKIIINKNMVYQKDE